MVLLSSDTAVPVFVLLDGVAALVSTLAVVVASADTAVALVVVVVRKEVERRPLLATPSSDPPDPLVEPPSPPVESPPDPAAGR